LPLGCLSLVHVGLAAARSGPTTWLNRCLRFVVGYRSAAGSSIVADALAGTEVLDLSEAVKSFQPATAAH